MNITEIKNIQKPVFQKKFIDPDRLPFGILPLDYALCGGMPFNIITQLFGPESGGKTTLSLFLAKSALDFCFSCTRPSFDCRCKTPLKKDVLYIQTEGGGIDPYWLNVLNIPEDRFYIGYPEFGEDVGNMLFEALSLPSTGLVILDSVGGIMPKAEFIGDMDSGALGLQSKLIGKICRKTSNILTSRFLKQDKCTVVFINQIRAIIGGNSRVPQEGIAGGHILKHFVRLSARINQLSITSSGGKLDENNMQPFLKFSASLLGQAAQMQIRCLAAKAEYDISVNSSTGYKPGTPMDTNRILNVMTKKDWLIKDNKEGYKISESFLKDAKKEMKELLTKKSWRIQDNFKKEVMEDESIRGILRYLIVNGLKNETES